MRALPALLLVVAICLAPLCAVAEERAVISDSVVAALKKDLAEASGQRESHVAERRALKNVARQAQALISASPKASNRFAVFEVLFEVQKRLLSIENVERNRSALFETCESLVEAPDEYSAVRLQADLMLSEKRLAAKNATLEERASDLAKLIERYRDTEAEGRSLLMAGLIVQKLEAPDLARAITQALDAKFSGDHEVIAFRRQHMKVHRLDATFTGEFERLDGTRLSFPSDILGHMSLVIFWSKDESLSSSLMEKIKEYEEKYPGKFHVFSFNLDELPDGGQSILREHGLDWTVMKLPGGRKHSAFRAYARGDAVALPVNAYGCVILKPAAHYDAIGWRNLQTDVFGISGDRISEDRYLAQVQSLLIGDCLVEGKHGAALRQAQGHPSDEVDGESIEDCFVLPPFRYRMSRGEALAMYRRVAEVKSDSLESSGRRIIALMGMWNLECEPKYLEQAVAESRDVLAVSKPAGEPTPNPSKEGKKMMSLSKDGKKERMSPSTESDPLEQIPSLEGLGWVDVVPRFCLARADIRENSEDAVKIVEEFFADCGGSNGAPASAVAAASILAVDARSLDLHDKYRRMFLNAHGEDSKFYAFASFLRDRQHRYRILKPNHTKRERWDRGWILNFGGEQTTNLLPEIELKQLDGQPLVLPRKNSDKMSILLFVEPPEDVDKNFPVYLDDHGRTNNSDGIRGMMGYSQLFVDKHVNKGIEVVAAFLCDDAKRVEWLMATNNWSCQAVMVPGGLKNPMVNRLGILSADKNPNVFLLRRDGTVVWSATGLPYREFGRAWVHHLGMKVHIEYCELEYGLRLLKEGSFEEASRIFAGPFLPWRPDRYGWRPVRYHGRALALMEMKDWDAALVAIDKAIDGHKLRHFRGTRSKSLEDWQKDGATVVMEKPCNVLSELWDVKAEILDGLGRKDEAQTLRSRFEGVEESEHDDIYQRFHDRLKARRTEPRMNTNRH